MRNEYVKPLMSKVSHTMVHLFSLVIIKFKKKRSKTLPLRAGAFNGKSL